MLYGWAKAMINCSPVTAYVGRRIQLTPPRTLEASGPGQAFVEEAASRGARLVACRSISPVWGGTPNGPRPSRWWPWLTASGSWPDSGSLSSWALPRTHRGKGPAYTPACFWVPGQDFWPGYRKLHLFDVDLPGAPPPGSRVHPPGDEVVTRRSRASPFRRLAIC